MEWLAAFQLPEYELTRRDGQYELRFAGPWTGTTMWEIPALAIINELRARAAMRSMSRFDLDVLYARAKAKLWSKVERLRILEREGPVRVSDFGTRRRHSFLWHRWCVEAMQEGLGGELHRHLQRQARHGHRPRGDRHQRPRAADGLCRGRRRRRGVARGALQGAEGLGEDVRRQSPGRAARLLRHHRVPPQRAGLGRGLEGRAAGFEAADRRRARAHRLVEANAAAIRGKS